MLWLNVINHGHQVSSQLTRFVKFQLGYILFLKNLLQFLDVEFKLGVHHLSISINVFADLRFQFFDAASCQPYLLEYLKGVLDSWQVWEFVNFRIFSVHLRIEIKRRVLNYLHFYRFFWHGAASNLLDVFEHRRVFAELLHEHAHVRISHWKLGVLFGQLPESHLVARVLVFLHHERVCPQLNQTQQKCVRLLPPGLDRLLLDFVFNRQLARPRPVHSLQVNWTQSLSRVHNMEK
jgi:hypothetical protein